MFCAIILYIYIYIYKRRSIIFKSVRGFQLHVKRNKKAINRIINKSANTSTPTYITQTMTHFHISDTINIVSTIPNITPQLAVDMIALMTCYISPYQSI